MADQFIVSARKYRPVTFDSVVGQSHITTTLKNAIRTNHLAQAFLFCGPRGVGKTTSARILAKTINCQNLTDDVEPCGTCDSCVAFQNNASFNVHELDAASNNSVDDIRNLIDQVRYPPQNGKYKIYIIDEVHMLSSAAFNAFLKTLEEPPSYAIFILATTEKHKILPTILSRCQIFDFNRIQAKDMADHLEGIAQKEGIKTEREALELIAQKADGGLRDALSMFDLNVTFSTDGTLRYRDVLNNLHVLVYDYYFRLTDALLTEDLAQTLLIFDEILKKGFDGHLFLVGLLEHFRNLLVAKDPATIQLLEVSETAKNKYIEQSLRATTSFLLSALSIGGQCDQQYKASKQQRLHVELYLMKLAHLPKILDLNSLPNDTDEKKKAKVVETPTTVPTKVAEPPTTYRSSSNGQTGVSKLRSTVQLQAITPSNQPQPITVSIPTPSEAPATDRPVTPEAIRKAWHTFTQKREKEGAGMNELVMLKREINITGTTIEVTLDNLMLASLLDELKPELLGYLRQTLQNRQIQVIHRLATDDVTRPPYTSQEKFNALAERNPALLELQKVLGLEVDF